MSWAFRKSIFVYVFSSGSCNACDLEVISCFTPKFDVERFGIREVHSPKHADVLIVTGAITKKAVPILRNIYEQMPNPKFVIAVGNCACGGGPFRNCENVVGGAEKVIPVDLKIIGCPPRPEVIAKGILEVVKNERNIRSCEKNEE